MDNHPIPQDVTGFQFKLVGNMTVKQFAYLATGIVFAWILLQLPVNILIKFPLCAFFAILGIGLAYFPVSGRPMDVMIGNYIKALIRPTQFFYEKTGGQIYYPGKTQGAVTTGTAQQSNPGLALFPKDKLKAYLETLDAKPKNKVDEIENNFLQSVSNLTINVATQQQNATPTLRVEQASPQPNPIRPNESPATPKEQEVEPIIPQVKPATPTSGSFTGNFSRAVGMPSVPEYPNLVTGITKDPRGNALSNILVEVKDSQGNPVRAFKTNELGRFASATPLVNGSYVIEFEDPKGQNKFEKSSFNVTGQIIMPIEAISVDTREELRRSLFASNTPKN